MPVTDKRAGSKTLPNRARQPVRRSLPITRIAAAVIEAPTQHADCLFWASRSAWSDGANSNQHEI
jgi:hypothetical protein